jgi:outer membrane scaffolding protein for murein synthesis (MipA/OmpV family)
MRYPFAALFAAGIALAPTHGQAADARPIFTRPPPAGTSDVYVVTITANGQFTPRFPGSRDLTGMVYPSLSFRRSDEPPRFTAPDDGISISVFDNPSFRVGPVARYQSGRYLQDDRRLFGLRKLDWDIEPGVFAEFWPLTFIRARLEARHGIRAGSGFAGNAGVDFVLPYQRFTVSVGPRMTFGDDQYVQRYFGVTPLEARRSRFAAFRPKGGITSLGLLGSVTYAWNETWATTAYVGYNRLIADAADGPIVRGIGSRDQLTFGAKLSYSFNFTR